jgi:predicted O-methyltransferase YrrM
MHDLMSPPLLARIAAPTEELNVRMACEPRTGALLRTLAAFKPAGRLLELGTGTGVGTAWLLAEINGAARLITVDTDPEGQSAARGALSHNPRLTPPA